MRRTVARRSAARMSATSTTCEALLKSLFDGAVDPDAVANACSPDVTWDDHSEGEPRVGRAAVRELIASKFPTDSLLVIDRLSDGARSGGFTWHRERLKPGKTSEVGLRG